MPRLRDRLNKGERAYRILKRKWRGDDDRLAKLEQIRNDDDMWCEFCCELDDTHERAIREAIPLMGGPLQDFLTWLIENQDAIFAFIERIIALFM